MEEGAERGVRGGGGLAQKRSAENGKERKREKEASKGGGTGLHMGQRVVR